MDASADALVTRSHTPLVLVLIASIVYVVVAVVITGGAMSAVFAQAHAAAAGGVSIDFDPDLWIREPTNAQFFGAPYVVPGTALHLTGATATVRGLPVHAVVLMALSGVAADLAGIGVGVCVGLLSYRVLRGAPFARATSRTLVVLAIVVMVGFEAQPVLEALGRSAITPSIVMSQPQSSDGAFFSTSSDTFFTLAPLYIGLALLGLAAVFRYGAQLQRDTEGLV